MPNVLAYGWNVPQVNGGPSSGTGSQMTQFYQGDPRWANASYGAGKTDIGFSGCGITSAAMVVDTLAGATETPLTLANRYGAIYHVDGTSWGLWPVLATDYKLKETDIGLDFTQATNAIKAGGLVIGSFVSPSVFTGGGHLMVLRAIDSSGSFYLADPAGIGPEHITMNTEGTAYTSAYLQSPGGMNHMWSFIGSTSSASSGNVASGAGYDSVGAVVAVLTGANLWPKGSSVPSTGGEVIHYLLSQGTITSGPGSGSSEATIFDNGKDMYMRLNGKYWGTGAAGSSGPGWISSTPSQLGFNAYHVPPSILAKQAVYQQPGSGSSSSGASANAATSMLTQANAEAFTAAISFPTVLDMTTPIILGGAGLGLMNDQQLLPFVQQLAQSSLRSFQSLPNGDFYAFYPDYFGETSHHKPYWYIDDIEILNGGINLTDQSLVTHQYAVGDNTFQYLSATSALYNELFSTGTITVFNAFLDPTAVGLTTSSSAATQNKADQTISGGMADIMGPAEAVEFVKRYGARPQVSNYPMVRSPLYEMFLAYQQFMLAWCNQFQTPFSFTFMPEVFPGGKVAFPNHGLQMYVNSVTHSWDYDAEAGFTTDAVLSAPAAMAGVTNPDLPPNMVQALVHPVRTTIKKKTPQSAPTQAQEKAQEITAIDAIAAQADTEAKVVLSNLPVF